MKRTSPLKENTSVAAAMPMPDSDQSNSKVPSGSGRQAILRPSTDPAMASSSTSRMAPDSPTQRQSVALSSLSVAPASPSPATSSPVPKPMLASSSWKPKKSTA